MQDFPLRVFPQGGKEKTRLAAVGGSEFVMDGAPMTFQRAGRNPEDGGNHLIRNTIARGLQDFLLAP